MSEATEEASDMMWTYPTVSTDRNIEEIVVDLPVQWREDFGMLVDETKLQQAAESQSVYFIVTL